MSGQVLVVLDFSGTLSLGAVRFARDEVLRQALVESGLWELGVDSLETFWREVVDPTWEVAATTSCGYARALCERVRALAEARGLEAEEEDLRARAEAFVARYLAYSAIDPAWGPLLRELAARPGVTTVVATDHYAEATPHILGQLAAMGVAAAPALQGGARVLVANSADLGALKADRAFWQRLRPVLGKEPLRRVVLVDDFGANEGVLDSYGDRSRVERRVAATAEVLGGVFGAPVQVFCFWLADRRGEGGAYEALVGEAGDFLRRAVAK